MNKESLYGLNIEVSVREDIDGTYIYNDDENNVIRIQVDPEERPDLIKDFNTLIGHLRMYHTGLKAGCMDCGTEFILSGVYEVQHRIEGVNCPDCSSDDIINLEGDINE